MEVLKLTPLFTYNYQCKSILLTSYIPIYMYIVSIQIIIDLFRVVMIFQTKYQDFTQILQQFLQLVDYEIDTSIILSNLINNMTLLLSFGLSSPVLSVSVCLGVMINISCWLIIIGKSIFQHQNRMNVKIKC